MFEPNSRYFGLQTAKLEMAAPDGETRTVIYVRRRFVPAVPTVGLVSHAVEQGERLDQIAARYLGDPTQFWRVCDANGALHPEQLVEQPGRRIEIPMPGGL